MSKYPIFLELAGRKVVVIGAGTVAAEKVKKLLHTDAALTIIAPDITKPLIDLAENTNTIFIKTEYSKTHLADAALVIAATDNETLNQQIYNDCRSLNILCNVVDSPALCDFFVPAVIRQGNLSIAVSTNGKCPAYAAQVRKKLLQIFTQEHGRFLNELEKTRQKLLEQIPQPDKRKKLMHELVSDESFEFFKQNGPAAWSDRADMIIQNQKSN